MRQCRTSSHGKKDLHPSYSPIKNSAEGPTYKDALMGEGSKKSTISSDTVKSRDWLPPDDGIEIRLQSSIGNHPLSDEQVDSYIRKALYHPSNERRLPVFIEICPG